MNLAKLKSVLKENKTRGLALDIDETLSRTTRFWMEQLQKRFGNPENLTPDALMEKYGYAENVPYWQIPEALKLMDLYRHSNEFQETIPLIENSNFVIQKINERMPIAIYITARPSVVEEGTKKWLAKHNFPEAIIITRPKNVSVEKTSEWKTRILENLYPEIIGIIDDQPALVNAFSKDYKGTIYLYNNIEHPRTDIHIVPCKTWDDVFKKVTYE